MKKIFLLLLMAVAFCGSAEAQKGMHSVGVDAGANIGKSKNLAWGGGIQYQYHISNHFSLGLSGMYFGEEEKCLNNLAVFLDVNWFPLKPKRWRPYISLGVGICDYQKGKYDNNYTSTTGTIDFGVGCDYRFANNWSLQAEIADLYLEGPKVMCFLIDLGIKYYF